MKIGEKIKVKKQKNHIEGAKLVITHLSELKQIKILCKQKNWLLGVNAIC